MLSYYMYLSVNIKSILSLYIFYILFYFIFFNIMETYVSITQLLIYKSNNNTNNIYIYIYIYHCLDSYFII